MLATAADALEASAAAAPAPPASLRSCSETTSRARLASSAGCTPPGHRLRARRRDGPGRPPGGASPGRRPSRRSRVLRAAGRRSSSCRAARPPSRSAAAAAAGATASTCSAWRSPSTAHPASAPWPPTPTASTAAEDNAGALVDARHAGARRGAGVDAGRRSGRQRRLRPLRGPRRPRRHRPNAHQRQRLPRGPRDVTRASGLTKGRYT